MPSRYLVAVNILAAAVMLAGCSKQTAEEKGKELATEKIDMAKGMGDAMVAKGEAAGDAVFTGLGKVFNGAAKGVAKSGRQIVADPSVASAGLDVSNVQNAVHGADGQEHGLDTYIVAAKAAKGQLRVIAYDVLEKEIGRASIGIERAADEGKYTFIPLEKQVQLQSINKLVFKYEATQLAAR